MSSNRTVTVTTGPAISFGGLLTLLFIGLKLGNVIDWSWLWVLSPLWISLAASLSIFLLILVVGGLVAFFASR